MNVDVTLCFDRDCAYYTRVCAFAMSFEHGNGLETSLNVKQCTTHTFGVAVSVSMCVTSLYSGVTAAGAPGWGMGGGERPGQEHPGGVSSPRWGCECPG